MATIPGSISLVLLGITATTGRALAGDAPLLVAIEAAPGLEVSAADLRRAIASELGARVVDAREPTAATASDLLLVSVDAHEIRMSLRAGAPPLVSRTIAAPEDRPGRLRSIAWLAGNLVRDQVAPIVATTAPPPVAATETRPPTEPPALPVSSSPASDAGPAAVLAAPPSPTGAEIRHAPWSITASGGPAATIVYDSHFGGASVVRGTAYFIDVQHQAAAGSPLLGLGLETKADEPVHYFGVTAFIGSGWHRGSWFVEGNLGLGVEVLDGRRKTVTVTNSSSALGTETTTTQSLEPIPGFYARAVGLAGLRVTREFDLVARLGAHASTSGQAGSFLSSTVGMRLRLP